MKIFLWLGGVKWYTLDRQYNLFHLYPILIFTWVNLFELEVQQDYCAMHIIDQLLNEFIDYWHVKVKNYKQNIIVGWYDVLEGQNGETNKSVNT